MRTKTSALIALPTALLLALSLSACDEEAVSTTATDSSSSSSSDSSASAKDKESSKDSKDAEDSKDSDDASATPSSKSGSSAGSSAGADGRTVPIGDLKTGDCVTEMVDATRGGETGTSDAKVVDCSAPHKYEMIGTGQSTVSSYAESNTPEEISAVCEPLLQSYVGSPSKAEDYTVAALTPMQSSWDQGDHKFTCFAQNADHSPLNKSIKNS